MQVSGYIVFSIVCGLVREGLQANACTTFHNLVGVCTSREYCAVENREELLNNPNASKGECSHIEVCCPEDKVTSEPFEYANDDY
ncbi:unnamed protein product, partial [Brenthis ino]